MALLTTLLSLCARYYILRIVSVLLMVSVLKVCTSFVPLTDYNTKMGWDGGLFLTLVAFNYVVANEVPKVNSLVLLLLLLRTSYAPCRSRT